MIAVDTNVFIAYFAGENAEDTEVLDTALRDQTVSLPPTVLAELLSAPRITDALVQTLEDLPMLNLLDGYWSRVGRMRSQVLQQGKRARLADTMIAQSCVDHGTYLLTRDNDFRHFTAFGLRLIR